MRDARKLLLLAMIGLLLSGCAPKAVPTERPPPVTRPTNTSQPTARATTAPPTPAKPATRPATAVPTFGKPSTQVGTALAWYPTAERVALARQGDAVLYSVVGGNIASDGSSLPCDGKAELWTYSFVSVAAQQTLVVALRGGAVASQGSSPLTRLDGQPLTTQDLEMYSGLYPTADWKVGSPQATQTANVLFQARYNVEPRHISYVWFNTKYLDFINNTKTNWMYWVLSYDPEKYPFQVTLDARTGEVKERP
jgi:hypothetical protein